MFMQPWSVQQSLSHVSLAHLLQAAKARSSYCSQPLHCTGFPAYLQHPALHTLVLSLGRCHYHHGLLSILCEGYCRPQGPGAGPNYPSLAPPSTPPPPPPSQPTYGMQAPFSMPQQSAVRYPPPPPPSASYPPAATSYPQRSGSYGGPPRPSPPAGGEPASRGPQSMPLEKVSVHAHTCQCNLPAKVAHCPNRAQADSQSCRTLPVQPRAFARGCSQC